jgi:proteasome accessory factor C
MAERATDVLARILELMALASRDGGIGIEEAAGRTESSPDRLLDDLRLVMAREFYHPPGWTEDIRIEIGTDSIHVSSGGRFDRPPALSQREALALALALRTAGHDRPPEARQEMFELADRLDRELAAESADDLWPTISMDDGSDLEGLRGLFEASIADRAGCRIKYLRPDELRPTERRIDPYRMAFANGNWFVIGYCHRRDDIRVFRLDRILEAAVTAEMFEIRPEFEPANLIDGGRVFNAAETVPVTVRYAPRIEAWIREKGPVRDSDGGGVLVDFEVADPTWIVRHVLQYGPDAELVEPGDLRSLVVEAVRRQVD